MTTKSHFLFGKVLLEQGLPLCSRAEADAFLLGCVEPDYNIATYLKGSMHGQKLKGHNYSNTEYGCCAGNENGYSFFYGSNPAYCERIVCCARGAAGKKKIKL